MCQETGLNVSVLFSHRPGIAGTSVRCGTSHSVSVSRATVLVGVNVSEPMSNVMLDGIGVSISAGVKSATIVDDMCCSVVKKEISDKEAVVSVGTMRVISVDVDMRRVVVATSVDCVVDKVVDGRDANVLVVF